MAADDNARWPRLAIDAGSGGRELSDYDDTKIKKGSKIRVSMDTLGHRLTLKEVVFQLNFQRFARAAQLFEIADQRFFMPSTGGRIQVRFQSP